MQPRILTLGLAAVLVAGAATAQSERPGDAQRRDQQRQTPGATSAQNDAGSVLRRLEGTWKVDVRVNPAVWSRVKGDSALDDRRRGQPAKPEGAASEGTKNCSGYAVSGLIMGGDTIRTVFVSNDMASGDRSDARSTQRTLGGDQASIDPEAFRAISYISFDPRSSSFDAVFMDNQRGRMQTHSGTYDATARRIVLNSDRGESRSGGNSHWHGDSRVVVELVGNDEYTVTMYAGEAGLPTRTGEGASPVGMTSGDILYTATYRRASGQDMTNINRMILSDDGLFSTRGRDEQRSAPQRTPSNPSER